VKSSILDIVTEEVLAFVYLVDDSRDIPNQDFIELCYLSGKLLKKEMLQTLPLSFYLKRFDKSFLLFIDDKKSYTESTLTPYLKVLGRDDGIIQTY
jgi:hypothetical protein